MDSPRVLGRKPLHPLQRYKQRKYHLLKNNNERRCQAKRPNDRSTLLCACLGFSEEGGDRGWGAGDGGTCVSAGGPMPAEKLEADARLRRAGIF